MPRFWHIYSLENDLQEVVVYQIDIPSRPDPFRNTLGAVALRAFLYDIPGSVCFHATSETLHATPPRSAPDPRVRSPRGCRMPRKSCSGQQPVGIDELPGRPRGPALAPESPPPRRRIRSVFEMFIAINYCCRSMLYYRVATNISVIIITTVVT